MRNRRAYNRDKRLKTIKGDIDTSWWSLIKKALPWVAVGIIVWAGLLKLTIMAIHYNMGGF